MLLPRQQTTIHQDGPTTVVERDDDTLMCEAEPAAAAL